MHQNPDCTKNVLSFFKSIILWNCRLDFFHQALNRTIFNFRVTIESMFDCVPWISVLIIRMFQNERLVLFHHALRLIFLRNVSKYSFKRVSMDKHLVVSRNEFLVLKCNAFSLSLEPQYVGKVNEMLPFLTFILYSNYWFSLTTDFVCWYFLLVSTQRLVFLTVRCKRFWVCSSRWNPNSPSLSKVSYFS